MNGFLGDEQSKLSANENEVSENDIKFLILVSLSSTSFSLDTDEEFAPTSQNVKRAIEITNSIIQCQRCEELSKSNIHNCETESLLYPVLNLAKSCLQQKIYFDINSRAEVLQSYKSLLIDFLHQMIIKKLFEDEPDPILGIDYLKNENIDHNYQFQPHSREILIFLTNRINEIAKNISKLFKSSNDKLDEEQLRDLFTKFLMHWFYFSFKELPGIDQEQNLLKNRKNSMPQKEPVQHDPNRRLQAFFLNSEENKVNQVLSQFPGAAPPTYSIEQFYSQLRKKQESEMNNRPIPVDECMKNNDSDNEEDNINKYDNCEVYELRKRDNASDYHQRGEGNRFGKG